MDEPNLRPTELTGLARKYEREEKICIPESSSVCLFFLKKIYFVH